ncbi:DeoR family glycerol-3-phosphate regulon repressor [Rhodobium gokarnense]|uniref:DeoR family glycerol-3-phosphate regulon repressor n=2 Tax=Rhodobium gokarnense TaxID=364296 RepID=A0ABT3H638_9HYPH|nr:DeoR family glycerol-3-phosphate regulon repressor [Rhodobium gokarnense]
MPDVKMPAVQRHKLILETVQAEGFVTVPGMADLCRVSEMTLRRDLDQLAEQNVLVRTHGGAVSLERSGGLTVDLVEPSVDARATRNRAAKQAIARRAVQMIDPGTSIALDIGTSTFELADLLQDVAVNIFTNSLKIAGHLSAATPDVYMPGGQVSGTEPSLIGARAAHYLNGYYFDIAFIGVSSLSTEGFFDYSLADAEIKRTLIARSEQSVVLLDSSKFERMSVALVASMGEIDVLVTDARPPEPLADALADAGVRVEIAG